MKSRQLGKSELRVSPIVFGGNVFGWTADAATSHRLLDAWLDAGLNTIDTADMYSAWVTGHKGGESEQVIGDWLRSRGGRDRVVILTKVGMEMGSGGKGLSRAWINQSIDASLKRLGTDYVDLYQAHIDDPATPLEETLDAFAELVRVGKVRVIGASNYSAARLKLALETSDRLGLPRFQSLQPHYNLVERPLFEGALEDLCRAEGLGVITYFSLASGFLTGKYRGEGDLGLSPRGGGMGKYLTPKGLGVLAALDAVAARIGSTPAAVALAWLSARPGVAAPIVSATSEAQLGPLVAAADLTLDADAVAALDQASA